MTPIELQSIVFIWVFFMFISNDVFRSPISNLFRDGGCSYWPTVELGLQQLWFLMSVRESQQGDEEAFAITRTMLVSDFHYVEEFLEVYKSKKEIRLKSLYVVTPKHINGTNGWVMDELSKMHWFLRPSLGAVSRALCSAHPLKHLVLTR